MAVAAKKIRAPGKITYRVMPGAHINKEKAAKYGRHLSKLARTHELTPEFVRDEARDPKSPLHDFFEWDDKKAAEQYRIERARYLLRSIAIQIVGPKGEVLETRAFHNVVVPIDSEEQEIRVYRPSELVFSDDGMKSQVVDHALQELIGWQDRYERYGELKAASFLVRRAIKTLRSKKP